jgi:hypothetical protein
MSNEEKKGVMTTPHTKEENTQEMSILMQKVLGTDRTPDFTKEQVDELLSQKREITGYIHDDKKRDSWDSKFYLVILLTFVLLFSCLVLWKKPDLFNEVLSFLTGAFGGGLGGYGLGSKKK